MIDWLDYLLGEGETESETSDGAQTLSQQLSAGVTLSKAAKANRETEISDSSAGLSLPSAALTASGVISSADIPSTAAEKSRQRAENAALDPSGTGSDPAGVLERTLRPRWTYGMLTLSQGSTSSLLLQEVGTAASSLGASADSPLPDREAAIDTARLDRLLERDARRFDGGFAHTNGGDFLWN